MELLNNKALRLASALEEWVPHEGGGVGTQAAAELRRLHAITAEMLAALKLFAAGYERWTDEDFRNAAASPSYNSAHKVRAALIAIAKAEAT